MTTTTKIRIDGESAGAQRAVKSLSDDFRAMGRTAAGAAGQTLRMTAAVLGAESVVAGLRKVMQTASQSVRDYAATNDEAGERLAALSERWAETRSQIGEYVLGAENAAVITGTLTGLLDGMGASSEQVADRQRAVRNALALVVDGMAVAVNIAAALRAAWGGLQVAIVTLSRGFESLMSASLALGAMLLRTVASPLLLIGDGLAAVAFAAEKLGTLVGGPIEDATTGLSDALGGMSDRINEAEAMLEEFARTSARGATSALDGLGNEIDEIGQATARGFISLTDYAGFLSNLADETRDGSSAQRSLRREIERTNAAIAEAAAAAQREAFGGASSAVAEAMAAANEALAVKRAAIEEQAAIFSEQKADRIIAAEERITAARDAALLAAQENEALLREAMERRAAVAQSTGEAIGQALMVGVSAQKDASRQIVGIIARELAARITAAIATSTILAATPGGQIFAAALGVAVASAAGMLAQIGGGKGGSGGRGGGGTTIGSVNVTISQTGAAANMADPRAIAAAVEDGVRRGTIRLGNA